MCEKGNAHFLDCGHTFHFDKCLSNYIEKEIKQHHRLQIKCPFPTCLYFLPQALLFDIIKDKKELIHLYDSQSIMLGMYDAKAPKINFNFERPKIEAPKAPLLKLNVS